MIGIMDVLKNKKKPIQPQKLKINQTGLYMKWNPYISWEIQLKNRCHLRQCVMLRARNKSSSKTMTAVITPLNSKSPAATM